MSGSVIRRRAAAAARAGHPPVTRTDATNAAAARLLRAAWRQQLGHVFGPVFVHPWLAPAATGTSQLSMLGAVLTPPRKAGARAAGIARGAVLAVAELDQPAVFCGADSGEVPGAYATALLRDVPGECGLTARPVDWAALCDADPGLRAALRALLAALDADMLLAACAVPRSCTAALLAGARASGAGAVDCFDWDVRSFCVACAACSAATATTTTTAGGASLPSWAWLAATMRAADTQATAASDAARAELRSLQLAYRVLLRHAGGGGDSEPDGGGGAIWLPPLAALRVAWGVVRTRSLRLCFSGDGGADGATSGGSSPAPARHLQVPCLVPLISSHLVVPRRQPAAAPPAVSPKRAWAAFAGASDGATGASAGDGATSPIAARATIATAGELYDALAAAQQQPLVYCGGRCLAWPRPHGASSKGAGGERLFVVVSPTRDIEFEDAEAPRGRHVVLDME